jgi:DNA-binding transcriptional regulator LsrR (DeoR family)
MSENRDELLARVAGLYYEDGCTQEQISARLGYSRSAISRLLTEARRTGIVEIYVRRPLERVAGLEQRLLAEFALQEVRVLRSQGLAYAEMLRRLGALGARWLEENLTGSAILGISWGTALYEVANALRPSPAIDVRVVQISDRRPRGGRPGAGARLCPPPGRTVLHPAGPLAGGR